MMQLHKIMMRAHKILIAAYLLSASAARAQNYSTDEAALAGSELARQIGMPDDKRITVETRFRDVLNSERFRAKYAGMQLRGVFAYQMGEGGLIVKVKKGRGLLRWRGSPHELHLELKSVTVGAQIGGSSEWGLAVIASAKDVTRGFGGDYSGGTVAASMGSAGTTMMELTNKGGFAPHHKIYLVGIASGASANAGGGQLTIRVLQ
jgi:hypothetical protein